MAKYLAAARLSLLVCLCLIKGDTMKLGFPAITSEGVYPRVRLEPSFQSLSSFTLCLWSKRRPKLNSVPGEEMTLFNYGVPGQDKEIYLSLSNKNVQLYVGGALILDQPCDGPKAVNWILGSWHHICVVWTTSHSWIRAYVDGIFCSRSSSTEDYYHLVPGNGVMVLGQALKGLDTDFHGNNSWYGDIANVQMWDEVLTYKQIAEVRKCAEKAEGNVVNWMKTPMLAFDGVGLLYKADVCGVPDNGDD